jgi:hypothetical protein
MATPSSLPQALVQPAVPDMLQRGMPGRALRGFGNLLQNETRVVGHPQVVGPPPDLDNDHQRVCRADRMGRGTRWGSRQRGLQ